MTYNSLQGILDFGRPNVEISQKMANGRLLFLAHWCLIGFVTWPPFCTIIFYNYKVAK